jgi:hypothetical protein
LAGGGTRKKGEAWFGGPVLRLLVFLGFHGFGFLMVFGLLIVLGFLGVDSF